MFFRWPVVGVALVITSGAAPYDPNAVFFSERSLQGALSDISKMQEPELRAFTRYLTECEPANSEEDHGCMTAYAAYRIEFGATQPAERRPIDELMAAKALRETYKRVGVDKGFNMEQITKGVDVMDKLEGAARARFRSLRGSHVN
jgi:hypothetical protein